MDLLFMLFYVNLQEIGNILLMESFGKYIQKRRESLFLKQEDVAEMAGITMKTIYLIENNKGNPSLQTLQKIMDVLGLEIKIQIKNTLNEGTGL